MPFADIPPRWLTNRKSYKITDQIKPLVILVVMEFRSYLFKTHILTLRITFICQKHKMATQIGTHEIISFKLSLLILMNARKKGTSALTLSFSNHRFQKILSLFFSNFLRKFQINFPSKLLYKGSFLGSRKKIIAKLNVEEGIK